MTRFTGALFITFWIAKAFSQSEESDFDIREALLCQGVNASNLFEPHLMERPFVSGCETAVSLIRKVISITDKV